MSEESTGIRGSYSNSNTNNAMHTRSINSHIQMRLQLQVLPARIYDKMFSILNDAISEQLNLGLTHGDILSYKLRHMIAGPGRATTGINCFPSDCYLGQDSRIICRSKDLHQTGSPIDITDIYS